MARLCVNVDHVATVRQARMTTDPDPLSAALLAEKAGCAGITVHLREDRRHIQDADVTRIKKSIRTRLNLEMATAREIVEFAIKTRPAQVTFVPERRKEITTEGGLDVTVRQKRLRGVIDRFHGKGIAVSLFIDPDPAQVKGALDVGARAIEINTGMYSEMKTRRAIRAELKKIEKTVTLAGQEGLIIHAGHGLNLTNVGPISAIPQVEELNIGHSIIGRAIMVGFFSAVREMKETIETARQTDAGH